MEWFLDKIGGFRSGGAIAFFLIINAFLYVDIISLIKYDGKLFEEFQSLSIKEIFILIIIFLSIYYTLRFFRNLLVIYIAFKFSKKEIDRKYYTLYELLDASVKENNSVKYEMYHTLKSGQETNNEVKLLSFIALFLLMLDCFLDQSVVRLIFEYKWLMTGVLPLLLLLGFYAVQENETSSSNTFIRKDGFEYKNGNMAKVDNIKANSNIADKF